MSVTEQGRKRAYDNISAGNATGVERTISGDAPPVKIVGGGEGTAGANAKGHSNLVVGQDYPTAVIPSNIAVGVTTLTGERLG
jgi:hypothetical protein